MNGFLLAIPIIFIRYGLLGMISKDALKRAGYFPPVKGKEKAAFWVYQITMNLMLLYLFFLRIKLKSIVNYFGLVVYLIGIVFYTISIVDFAKPKENGMNLNGLYRLSRNPMYISFFLYFLGCSSLTNSWSFLFLIIIFQLSSHYLILSEERWCIKEFGEEYKKYMKKVRRYI